MIVAIAFQTPRLPRIFIRPLLFCRLAISCHNSRRQSSALYARQILCNSFASGSPYILPRNELRSTIDPHRTKISSFLRRRSISLSFRLVHGYPVCVPQSQILLLCASPVDGSPQALSGSTTYIPADPNNRKPH
jgi:hypothetical protein